MKHILFLLMSLFFISNINSQIITMTVNGERQGIFKGESLRIRDKDKIEVNSFTQEVISPRDAASGQATGKRQYQPVTFVKASGAASPQFFQALATNEALKNVVIELYQTDPRSGQEMVFYRITLENAFVSGYKQSSGGPTSPSATGAKFTSPLGGVTFDEIKLTFSKITVESLTGKTMATDSWMAGEK